MESNGRNWDIQIVKEKPQKGHVTKTYRKGCFHKKKMQLGFILLKAKLGPGGRSHGDSDFLPQSKEDF